MISNAEIADSLSLAAKLLELHDKDERRIKTFSNAAYVIERLEPAIYEMTERQLLEIQGIGKVLATIILEIIQAGTFTELQDIISDTPSGLIDLFKVKGLGVKKIKTLWKELSISNLVQLKEACVSNQIARTKGFGKKTQDSILESLQFMESQRGKLRMNKAAILSEEIAEILKNHYQNIEITGQIKRQCEVVNTLSFLIISENYTAPSIDNQLFIKNKKTSTPFVWRGWFDENEIPIELHFTEKSTSVKEAIFQTSTEKHLQKQNNEGDTFFSFLTKNPHAFLKEEEAYTSFGIPYIIPPMREGLNEFEWAKTNKNEDIVTWNDLKGSLHNHSTYSDGKHSLRQMAEFCKSLGLSYFGIADHSQTASYAQGLLPTRIAQQHQEIDVLNQEIAPFRILKGIESDILSDGSLDYDNEVLASFDYVVASVHQTLSMDIVRATDRLLRAIENPYTTILGHPTGRLLLAREGYPIDYKTVIDACATHNVVMEINASPYRLDIDWRWISYCMEKGVLLSINPDAHEMNGFYDMHFGVAVAQKAGLTKAMTFNAKNLAEMIDYLENRKKIKAINA